MAAHPSITWSTCWRPVNVTADPGPVIREIVFDTEAIDTDHISDLLIELGALSVVVEDGQTDPEHETPIFGEPGSASGIQAWPHSRIVVLLEPDTDPDAFWQEFCAEDERFLGTPRETRTIADRDWVSETQRQFTPFALPGRLWVGPHWLEPPSQPANGVVIRIDPGMAFGTGSHATTQLCLEALLSLHEILRGRSDPALGDVLDIGCGSGILAIAAAKLGARSVMAVDIDPQAIETTRRNAVINNADITVGDATEPLVPADIVIANILAQPLRLLAPALTKAVRPGGSIILSGILARQADDLLSIYRPLAPHLDALSVIQERDGWVCLGTLGQGAAGQAVQAVQTSHPIATAPAPGSIS
jgi:ribosomal protein L11 methyltransferase